MRYRLLALDLDHTLVTGVQGVSPRNREALARARAAGCRVIFCTGRGRYSTLPVAAELGLLDGPHILFNGAAIFPSLKRPPEDVLLLEREAIEQCLSAVETGALGLSGFEDPRCGDRVFLTQPNAVLRRWAEHNPERARWADSLEGVLSRPLIAFLMWGEEAQVRRLRAELGEPSGVSSPRVAWSKVLDGYVVELSAPGGTKGAALARLAGRLGIDREAVVAVGDAHADICMLKYAGLGVAVGNAVDEAKAEADYVGPACADDCVAHVVDRFILSD
jgi:Cof subfamily protein (haloacid dehalogenase superfamily)